MVEIQRPEELEVELDKHQDAILRLRLLFFLHQNFDDMKYACESFKVGLSTAYEWVHKWNQGGIELLEDHKNSGRPTKLKKEEVEQLKIDLDDKNWELKEIKELVENKYNITISKSSICRILRNKIKMHYAKPYKS